MGNITFMDELEQRLKDLEKEIETLEMKKNNYVMHDLMHEFDSAMDRTTEYKPVEFTNIRFVDY